MEGLKSTFKRFTALESSGGVVLFIAAILALIVDNTPWSKYYVFFLSIKFGFHLQLHHHQYSLVKPLLLWINDGLMAIFFLLVGLEVKREIFDGELNTFAKAILPAIAAVGGMVVPALVYLYFNHTDKIAMHGWAIPTATDIAFSLGILSLLKSRIPKSLKVFLTALAIFDDIGAIIIIAVFYSSHISAFLLLIAGGLAVILFIFNRLGFTHYAPYILIGLIMWVLVLKSGIHATLVGIVVALAIPLKDKKRPERSPSEELEYQLHPWVAFLVLPLFAFANAGVSFWGMNWGSFILPIPLGIALGLFVGKQIGITAFTWAAVKLNIAHMPEKASWFGVYGVSLLAGVGFTMSLFIGSLAFAGQADQYAAFLRMGVLMGSLLSGVIGFAILKYTNPVVVKQK